MLTWSMLFFIHCRSRSTKSWSYNVPPGFVNLLQHAHVQTVAYRPQLIIWGYKSYGVVRTYRSLVTSNKCKCLLLGDLSLLHFNPLRSRSLRWKNKPKHCSGWFVVKEKHCSDWKNKLKKIDYKRSEQGWKRGAWERNIPRHWLLDTSVSVQL